MLPKSSFGSICLACLFLLQASEVAGAEGSLREPLQALRSQSNPSIAGAPLASARLLDDFYRARDYRYVWQDSRQVQDLLRLAERLSAAINELADALEEMFNRFLPWRSPSRMPVTKWFWRHPPISPPGWKTMTAGSSRWEATSSRF